MGIYRECAGVVLFNNQGKVLLFARNDQKGFEWQFVQGGVEQGETPKSAALRELSEETSITSAEIIYTLPVPLCYNFPEDVLRKFALKGNRYIGQRMHWFLAHFKGDEKEINLSTKTPEFKAYRWGDISQPAVVVVDFKKDVYKKACNAFLPRIEDYLKQKKA